MRIIKYIQDNIIVYFLGSLSVFLLVILIVGMIDENAKLDLAAKEMAKKWGVSEQTAKTLIQNQKPSTTVMPVPIVMPINH